MSDVLPAAVSAQLKSPIESPRAWLGDAAVVLTAALLIFAQLGYYPFWGDEADTVIFGRSAWETGDMGAWYDGNLYAYRNGAPLEHLKNRAAPPLPYYVVAAFWGVAGDSRFGLRFPFALCGVATVALMQLAWRRLGFTLGQRLLLGGALACNVSFVLYSRQCRYYALATFLSLLLVYLYATFDGSRRRLAALVLTACLLAATQFMNFAALMAALLVDYAFWQQHRRKLTVGQWAALLAPTTIVFAALVYVYNPLGKDLYPVPEQRDWRLDKLKLLWWSVRDLNYAEYGIGLLLAAALPIGVFQARRRDNPLILRLWVASALFLFFTTLLSPQPIDRTHEADIRYFMPLIVPCVSLSVLTLLTLVGGRAAWAAPFVALIVFTNIAHVPWDRGRWQSTLGEYLHELREPRRPASQVISEWLKANVPARKTVALMPTDWIAPPIVHAPHVFYAWQLDKPRRAEDYIGLDERLFLYKQPVDLIVLHGFGNLREVFEEQVLPRMAEHGMRYEPAVVLDAYYDDRTRPELIWHWFREQPYDREKQAVYVYRRVAAPDQTPAVTP